MSKRADISYLVDSLSLKRGCSKVEARERLDDAIGVIVDALASGMTVSVRNAFTISHRVVKARSGVFNGKQFESLDRNSLSISVGKTLEDKLNNR